MKTLNDFINQIDESQISNDHMFETGKKWAIETEPKELISTVESFINGLLEGFKQNKKDYKDNKDLISIIESNEKNIMSAKTALGNYSPEKKEENKEFKSLEEEIAAIKDKYDHEFGSIKANAEADQKEKEEIEAAKKKWENK